MFKLLFGIALGVLAVIYAPEWLPVANEVASDACNQVDNWRG
jgi:hypothetical protein